MAHVSTWSGEKQFLHFTEVHKSATQVSIMINPYQ